MSVKEQDVVKMHKETIHFKDRGQVTIPKAIVDELGLKKGDLLEVRIEDGRIVLVPAVAVPRDQAWYWSEQWQAEEREVDKQIAQGEVTESMESDEALSVLDHLIRRDGH